MTPLRFAVIGDPVAHSRSPAMQTAAFRALGLPHTYEALRVPPDELPRVIAALRAGTYQGLSVTVPHKQSVLALVDELHASARAVGAANVLVRSPAGRLVAHNTDAPALAAELDRLAGSDTPWSSARALVIGSGGAARAAIAAVAALGVHDIAVRARSFDDPRRVDAFQRTAPAPIVAQAWRPCPESEKETRAVIQATSAGMNGADPGDAVADVVSWVDLPTAAIAIDVVYVPRDTPFLRAAQERQLRRDDGLGMLARQGALALELWLDAQREGWKAPLEVMRGALQ
ncbi:MAG: shikimate dehydrogenase [Myxococcota bacterium]|nr:shikimate dehydrogenase [Myxococcota bacterium]